MQNHRLIKLLVAMLNLLIMTNSHAIMLQTKRDLEPTPHFELPSQRGNPPFYDVFGKRYYVKESSQGYFGEGIASWYGPKFHGKSTSSGETYDMYAMTAAHKELPIPCYVKVTNVENGRSIVVKVNDRGPFHSGRIIDLSYTAARKLGIVAHGTAKVTVAALPPFQHLTTTVNNTTRQIAKQLYLQLGAFGEQANAKDFADSIKRIAKKPISIFSSKQPFGMIYRVKIGPFKNQTDAEQMNLALAEAGISQGMFVRM